ncbi:hypothetical protein XELAEV_18000851mg [Xenopus laevis]|nr:hypothetical protein XELAEV_18000851mg [Xenopus laevis]
MKNPAPLMVHALALASPLLCEYNPYVCCRPGSIIVEYNLTLEISYQENISVTAQYEDLLQTITKAVEKTDNYSIYCPYEGNLCFNNSRWLQRASLRSEEDSCRNETPSGFEEFFKASIIGGNLVCLSDCNPQSKKNYDCNVGICQIQNGTGPHCLCPRTDLYIYSSEKCNGQMLKSAVYGGVGAAIAVLGVIIAAVGFLLIRAKKHKKLIPLAKNQEDKWYEDENDNEWSSRRGFSTINYGAADGEEGNTNGSYSSSNIGSFRPALQNVDTALRV